MAATRGPPGGLLEDAHSTKSADLVTLRGRPGGRSGAAERAGGWGERVGGDGAEGKERGGGEHGGAEGRGRVGEGGLALVASHRSSATAHSLAQCSHGL